MNTLKKTLLLLGAIMTVTTFYSCEDLDWSLGGSQSRENCVDDIITQLTGDVRLDIGKSDMGFGIKTPHLNGLSNHVQGVGRLSDWNGMGRMVLTETGTDKGFHVAFQSIENATEGLYSTIGNLSDPISFDIRDVPAYGNHDHPGGLQAHGDYVAIAMEGKSAEHAAVYFLKVEGRDVQFINSLVMDGSRGEPYQANQRSAETAGFVELDSGHFLVAVSSYYSAYGKRGIWFYESTTQFIDETTEWEFINFKEFTCGGYGQEQDDCFVGAGGGLNLVTDCSGDIYMLTMHGTSIRGDFIDDLFDFWGLFEKDKEWLQVFHIWKEGDEIALQKVTQQRDKLGLVAANNKSFRWAGGSYISKQGILAIFNTERRRLIDDNDYVNGEVYLGKK